MSCMTYAFEHDRTSVYLRNQYMHFHFRKLDNINHRKNTFLPLINFFPPLKTKGSPSKYPTQSLAQKYVINRDNKILFRKLIALKNRESQAIKDEGVIDGYLEMKRNTRENVRRIKTKILSQSNIDIKQRIENTKPVIDKSKINNDFDMSRVYFNQLKKIRPNKSVCELFLTKNESKIIDNYNRSVISSTHNGGFLNRNKSMGNFIFNDHSKENSNNSSTIRSYGIKTCKNSVKNTKKNCIQKIDQKLLNKIGYTFKGRSGRSNSQDI